MLVVTEIQSEMRRLQQLVRWSAEKAAALPSWEGWAHPGEEPRVTQLLVVRRTRATVQVAREHERQLLAAYPAHPDDALSALAGDRAWPRASLVWAVVEGGAARMVARR